MVRVELCHLYADPCFSDLRFVVHHYELRHREDLHLEVPRFEETHSVERRSSVLAVRRLSAMRSLSVGSLVLLYVLMLQLLLRASVRRWSRSFLTASYRRIALPFVV